MERDLEETETNCLFSQVNLVFKSLQGPICALQLFANKITTF